eukprot:1448802-Prymnesium_polylepis.1
MTKRKERATEMIDCPGSGSLMGSFRPRAAVEMFYYALYDPKVTSKSVCVCWRLIWRACWSASSPSSSE